MNFVNSLCPLWLAFFAVLPRWDKRTSSERSFKRKKTDYRIEQARVRSREQWFVRFTLAAICQHLDAWAKTSTIDFKELCRSWQLEIVNK